MTGKKTAPTLTRGVAKVPVVMQLEALECGAAALDMIMAYYGKWVPLEEVRLACGVSRDGSNAKNIYLAAQNYGFDVKAMRMSPESLRDKGQFPCIIHWNMNHFVVLDGAGAAVAFVTLATVISYLFGIVNSVTSRIFLDRLLTGHNPEWLNPFLSALIALAVVQIAVSWVQAIYSLKISGKMAVIGSTSYVWKVLHLPMEFFSQRMAGDIQSRLALNSSIAGTLVGTFAPLLLNSVMMVFYLALMLRQSPILTAVGIFTLLLNAVLSKAISDRRMNVARVQMRDAGMLEAVTVTGIEMIETIKASGAEKGFFQKWAGHQAAVNAQEVKAERTEQRLGVLPMFLSTIANYAVLVLGVWLTMQGKFSLGAVMMFQGFLNSFMSPAMTLVSAGQAIQEMRTQMERVEDVMEYPDDASVTGCAPVQTEQLDKLRGNLELRNVTFGYSRLAEPLIENFSLSLKTGDRVALVGASGCGKSTISKLITGMYRPWSGEILFDGKPRGDYPRETVVSSLAVVDQEIILFDDTIENNIKMWDSSIEDFEVILAARDAQIHDDIVQMPGGYRHKLTSGGRNLSGGQRQRLEIARVLSQDPTIIILDEATSALDAKTESDVVRAIKDRGITCVVIAHRLSTVRDCDEIIVLDHGKVVERGRHEDLIRAGGAYAELVANE